MSEFVNNSGEGKNVIVPDEVKAFSWGALTMNWVWGIFNNSFITLTIFLAGLLGFIPFIGWVAPLALCIWFGIHGNEWAWQNKKWESLEHFHRVQKNWAIAGIILVILGTICSIASAVVAFLFAGAIAGAS